MEEKEVVLDGTLKDGEYKFYENLGNGYAKEVQVFSRVIDPCIKELQQENFELNKENWKLKDDIFNLKKEYQETYKDVRIEIKEYKEQIAQLKEQLQQEQNTNDSNNHIVIPELENQVKELKEQRSKAIEYCKDFINMRKSLLEFQSNNENIKATIRVLESIKDILESKKMNLLKK